MNRIDQCFAELKSQRRTGLIPFVTAGDPDPSWTVAILHALVKCGADIIELGMPFSDPMADGVVIQKASERALGKGMTLTKVLDIVSVFRTTDTSTPVVLMGYLNPIEYFGWGRFAAAAQRAGVDGVLLVDCPPEEADDIHEVLEQHQLKQIFLASPTTTPLRLVKMAALAKGYVYYVSFSGITGADRLAVDEAQKKLCAMRTAIKTPLAVGFGIRTAEQAVALAQHADAIVIGSALVEKIAAAPTVIAACLAATEFLVPIRTALNSAQMTEVA